MPCTYRPINGSAHSLCNEKSSMLNLKMEKLWRKSHKH